MLYQVLNSFSGKPGNIGVRTDFILKNEDLKTVLGWSFFGLVKHLLSRISL